MERAYFIPEIGKVYTNQNGNRYRCINVNEHCGKPDNTLKAQFQRISDGWNLTAHGPQMGEDGRIEWNYSTGGYWPDSYCRNGKPPQ